MPSRYTFAEYSSDWAAEYEREADRWRGLIGDAVVEIHHIGSTSVPGLAAKPVIDLLPVVTDLAAIDALTPRLESAGYKSWGEYGIAGRRLFTKDALELRTHNVHIFPTGHADIERHLAFCEYLRHHDAARHEYAALKRSVYAAHPADIAGYCDGKDAWIKALEPAALAWYRNR